MTENQKRQQKTKIKTMLRMDNPMGLPREQKKLARNRDKRRGKE